MAGSAMKQWFRANSRKLSVLGTILVVLTFVTKEELREHWKSSAEALENALRLRLLLDSDHRVYVAIEEMNADLDKLVKQSTPVAEDTAEMGRARQRFLEADEASRQNLESVDPLVKAMPDGALKSHWLKLQADYQAKRVSLLDTRYSLFAEKVLQSQLPGVLMRTPAMTEKRMIALRADGNRAALLATETFEASKEVLERARQETERNRRLAKIADWASAALYLIGIALGALAKIYGGDEELVAAGD